MSQFSVSSSYMYILIILYSDYLYNIKENIFAPNYRRVHWKDLILKITETVWEESGEGEEKIEDGGKGKGKKKMEKGRQKWT